MNKKTIAYLNALEIDVWVTREEKRELEKSVKPVNQIKSQSETTSDALIPSLVARSKSPEGNPTHTDGLSTVKANKKQYSLRLETIGVVGIVTDVSNRSVVKLARDIAQYVNKDKLVPSRNDVWSWPSTGFDQNSDDEIRKGLRVWLRTRLIEATVLLVAKDQATKYLLNEFEIDILRINLDETSLQVQGKLQIWNQLKSLTI